MKLMTIINHDMCGLFILFLPSIERNDGPYLSVTVSSFSPILPSP